MADATIKFPPEIVMNDDDPKKGYLTLFLTIPDMKVKKKSLFSKAEVKNGNLQVTFKEDSLRVEVKVEAMGKSAEYHYIKNMPEQVNPVKCSHEVKDELLMLHIAKVTPDSWTAHQRYLMRRD